MTYIISLAVVNYEIVQREGEKKDGGKRIPFCGLTVTFLASVSGRNE